MNDRFNFRYHRKRPDLPLSAHMPMCVRLIRHCGMLPLWADPSGGAANAHPTVLADSPDRDY
jgi:hypothetical protein